MRRIKLWLIRKLSQDLYDKLVQEYLQTERNYRVFTEHGYIKEAATSAELKDIYAWQITALGKLREGNW